MWILTRSPHHARVSTAGRHRLLLSLPSLLALVLAPCLPAPATAEGRYSRRQANRGEQTDTSAKLGTFAFINDLEQTAQRLAFFVDAGGCRDPLLPDLVPMRIGLAYRGDGGPLPLAPERFQLRGPGLAVPLTALRQDQVLALPRGRAALGHAARSLGARHAPLPFGAGDGLRVPTAFHADPSASVALNDDTELPAAAWFSDVVFFRLPPGFALRGERLHLAFVGDAGEPLVEVIFRVEQDPQLNRKAFRRAKKARKQEEKRARRADRTAAAEEALGEPSSR